MPHRHSGNVLSFIGDAVITLRVREYLISQNFTRAKDLQEKSIVYVSANGQAEIMEHLLKEEMLDEREHTIYKRGRNANLGATAKNASIVTYRVASGYEALIGYLYYDNQKRMDEILDQMIEFHADKVK